MRDNVKGGALTETTFFILLSLYKSNHGYGIMQFIENETAGRLSLGAGTLYGAINTLLKKGWIKLYNDDTRIHDSDVRKKEYIITEQGKRISETELKRLNEVYIIADKIIGGNKNDNKEV